MKTLIAEDDFVSRMFLQALLRRYGSVDVAVTGKEALVAFKAALDEGEGYGLVCLDVMMPEMDGHGALRAMRELERELGVPAIRTAKIVMTTALDDFKNVMSAFAENCDGYLVKPIVKEKFQDKLRELGLVGEDGLSARPRL